MKTRPLHDPQEWTDPPTGRRPTTPSRSRCRLSSAAAPRVPDHRRTSTTSPFDTIVALCTPLSCAAASHFRPVPRYTRPPTSSLTECRLSLSPHSPAAALSHSALHSDISAPRLRHLVSNSSMPRAFHAATTTTDSLTTQFTTSFHPLPTRPGHIHLSRLPRHEQSKGDIIGRWNSSWW